MNSPAKHPTCSDVLVLGAQLMDTRALVCALAGRRVPSHVIDVATAALDLVGEARTARLRELPIGPQVLAALELGRRMQLRPSPARRRVVGPSDVAALVQRVAPHDVEELWVLVLDVRLQLVRMCAVARGDATTVRVSAADVLRVVLSSGGSRCVLAHRHLDDAMASGDDVTSTVALAQAAAMVGVRVLDHVVLGPEGYVSLLREGHLAVADRRYR